MKTRSLEGEKVSASKIPITPALLILKQNLKIFPQQAPDIDDQFTYRLLLIVWLQRRLTGTRHFNRLEVLFQIFRRQQTTFESPSPVTGRSEKSVFTKLQALKMHFKLTNVTGQV